MIRPSNTKIIADTLLMTCNTCGVSHVRSLPASNTLAISLSRIIANAVAKSASLSQSGRNANAVQVVSQKSMGAGFSILMKNPCRLNFSKSRFLKLRESPLSSAFGSLRRKKETKPIIISMAPPVRAMVFSYFRAALTNSAATFPNTTSNVSLADTPKANA